MIEEHPAWGSETPAWRGGERDATTGLMRWHVEEGPLCLDVGPADWRAYRLLKVRVGCARATGACLRLEVLGCEEELLGWATFVADWQGEQGISFPLSAFEPRGDEERWHLVHALRLSCERAGSAPTTLSLGAVEVNISPSVLA